MSNVKNYTEQGGEKTIIGGTLEITAEGQVAGMPTATFQADSIAADVPGLVTDFNALLAKLIAAGLMASE